MKKCFQPLFELAFQELQSAFLSLFCCQWGENVLSNEDPLHTFRTRQLQSQAEAEIAAARAEAEAARLAAAKSRVLEAETQTVEDRDRTPSPPPRPPPPTIVVEDEVVERPIAPAVVVGLQVSILSTFGEFFLPIPRSYCCIRPQMALLGFNFSRNFILPPYAVEWLDDKRERWLASWRDRKMKNVSLVIWTHVSRFVLDWTLGGRSTNWATPLWHFWEFASSAMMHHKCRSKPNILHTVLLVCKATLVKIPSLIEYPQLGAWIDLSYSSLVNQATLSTNNK